MFEFEGLKFQIPSSTLLSGPMAAAKPIFAQKFIVKWLNDTKGKVVYFATSSPIDNVIKNLNILGLKEEELKYITFFDYDPEYREVIKADNGIYKGDFSDVNQLTRAIEIVDENSTAIIPSFTLLLVGSKDKLRLAKALIEGLVKKPTTSFIAVNSDMFVEVNKLLEEEVDNVIEFMKENQDIYFKVKKFKGGKVEERKLLNFPRHLFENTKKEVARRTSLIIRKKKLKHIG